MAKLIVTPIIGKKYVFYSNLNGYIATVEEVISSEEARYRYVDCGFRIRLLTEMWRIEIERDSFFAESTDSFVRCSITDGVIKISVWLARAKNGKWLSINFSNALLQNRGMLDITKEIE